MSIVKWFIRETGRLCVMVMLMVKWFFKHKVKGGRDLQLPAMPFGKQMFLQPKNMINRYMGQTKYVQKFLKREGNITIGRKKKAIGKLRFQNHLLISQLREQFCLEIIYIYLRIHDKRWWNMKRSCHDTPYPKTKH